jgi:branched-chain amino acid transport system permease protein
MFPESLKWSSLRVLLGLAVCICLVLLPVVSTWLGQGYYLSFATRIVIYAIAATGLNLILGYAGLVSLGHALFVAIGAFVVGICSFHGVTNGWVHLLIALGLTAVISALTGIVSLRTRGIGFIMITLAFAQMFYFFTVSLKQYGGDDGLPIDTHSVFDPLPSIDNKYVLYYLALIILFAAMYLVWRIVNSRFGYVLRGFHSNERRMLAAGFPRLRYQLAAYVLSALICCVSGILLANLTMFASPSYLSWQASGDLILIVVLGGMGTVMGPLVGTVVFLILEEVLSALTQHWMAVLGIFILAIALYARRGVWGGLTQLGKGSGAKEQKHD